MAMKTSFAKNLPFIVWSYQRRTSDQARIYQGWAVQVPPNGSSGPFRIIMMMLPCRSTHQELTITRPISTHRYPSPLPLSYTCVDFKHRIDLLIKCPSSLIFINVSTRPSFIWIQKWPADSYHFLLILLWATRIEPSILVCNHDQWFMYFGH